MNHARQRDHSEKSEAGRLARPPKSKTKIRHHMNSIIGTRQPVRLDSNYETPLACGFV